MMYARTLESAQLQKGTQVELRHERPPSFPSRPTHITVAQNRMKTVRPVKLNINPKFATMRLRSDSLPRLLRRVGVREQACRSLADGWRNSLPHHSRHVKRSPRKHTYAASTVCKGVEIRDAGVGPADSEATHRCEADRDQARDCGKEELK